MKKTQVFFGVKEVRPEREDLSDEERSRRPSAAGLNEILAYPLERDLNTTARRLAVSLGISPQTVMVHLHEGLRMKCFHLRWVPHTLTDPHKAKRVCYAQEMIEHLDNDSRIGSKYRLTGDESGMTYDQGPTQMWPSTAVASMKGLARLIIHRKP
jgi:hypothetical protein